MRKRFIASDVRVQFLDWRFQSNGKPFFGLQNLQGSLKGSFVCAVHAPKPCKKWAWYVKSNIPKKKPGKPGLFCA
jgi:hypothetical protein